jgi:hypothetical protein
MRFQLLLTCMLLLMATVCHGQSYLTREIDIDRSGQRLGDVLETISKEQGFYFSYNSNLVAEDSLITAAGFRGTVEAFLGRTFGSDYEFKETPGYVIIRYAPRSLKLVMHVENERKGALVVEGRIRDADNNSGIYGASVYEPNVLVSTLSDSTGRFRLAIRRPHESIWLKVSKANYRDTTVVLLPPVQVRPGRKQRRYTFYPGEDGASGLENSALGRFFTNSKRRIQRINLGGFFAHSPYQVSLTPGLSSQGLFNSQIVNEVSLNIIGGYTAGVRGVEIAGAFNINAHHAQHVQVAGVFNLVGRDVRGVQVAGVSNTVVSAVSGVQLAGVTNWAGHVHGMQLAGAFNKADNVGGIQLAGVLNMARKVTGVQVAALVNIADSSDYPIGFVNLIRNGRKTLSVGADESGMVQLTFRSGGRVLYGLIGLGYDLGNGPLKYGVEAGIGAALLRRSAFLLTVELASRTTTDLKTATGSSSILRLLPQFDISPHITLSAGPTISATAGNDARLRPGAYGGISYRW